MSCGKLIFMRSDVTRTFSCLYQTPNPIAIAIHEMGAAAFLTHYTGGDLDLNIEVIRFPETKVDGRKR